MQIPKACNRASGQALHIVRIYKLELQIGHQRIKHPIHVLQNLHNEVILGINLIHVHQLTYNPKTRGFSWGLSLQWNTGHPKVTQNP
jgi:predicted aspartyl protease